MKIYLEEEVPQGSARWHSVRMGIPTASRASDVITEVKGDLSEKRHKYGYQLVAERVLQEPFTTDISHLAWVIHGKEREDEAAEAYAAISDVETTKVGFVATDDGRYGCSPDRLIPVEGNRGAVEIKAPSEVVHIGYLLGERERGKKYKPQQQMQILVCDLNWNDFFSHNERCPPYMERTHPDDSYIARLETALDIFTDELDAMEATIRKLGLFMPARAIEDDAARLANALIADLDQLRRLQDILNREGEAEFIAALSGLPREHQQRVREAVEAAKNILRAGA